MNAKDGNYPEAVKRRIELSRLFYSLTRNEKRKWGRLLHKGFDEMMLRLEHLAEEKHYLQERMDERMVVWRDAGDAPVECLFCFIPDAADLEAVSGVYEKIKALRPAFAYAIVHQRKDGEGQYDIFRFSPFSYLEHCNRIRVPTRKRLD